MGELSTVEKILVELFLAKKEYDRLKRRVDDIPDDEDGAREYCDEYIRVTREYRDKLEVAVVSGYSFLRKANKGGGSG